MLFYRMAGEGGTGRSASAGVRADHARIAVDNPHDDRRQAHQASARYSERGRNSGERNGLSLPSS